MNENEIDDLTLRRLTRLLLILFPCGIPTFMLPYGAFYWGSAIAITILSLILTYQTVEGE